MLNLGQNPKLCWNAYPAHLQHTGSHSRARTFLHLCPRGGALDVAYRLHLSPASHSWQACLLAHPPTPVHFLPPAPSPPRAIFAPAKFGCHKGSLAQPCSSNLGPMLLLVVAYACFQAASGRTGAWKTDSGADSSFFSDWGLFFLLQG